MARLFPFVSKRVGRPVVEALEARQLLAGDPSIVFPVPFGFAFDKPHGGVVDSVGLGTGFTSVQPNANGTEYRKGLIYLRPGASLLRVKSDGDNYGNDNSLVNGLETTFSAANTWSVNTTIEHPFNISDGGGEGIMFGPDCNNFIRLALVNRGGNIGIEFIDEQKISVHGGFRRQLSSTLTNIGTIGSIDTLELILGGDSVTGRVRAYYRLNGGTLEQLPAVIRLWPDKRKAFFSSEALAGICVFNAPGAETTVANYDSFSITAGLPSGAGSTDTLGASTTTKYFNDVRGDGGSPTQRVTLSNVGKSTITINSISLAGTDPDQFFMTGQPTGSFSLAPGATESFSVGMSATSTTTLGIKTATLSISSTGGTKDIPLRGIATAGLGGSNQPSLTRILRLYQIPTNVGEAENATVYPNPPGAGSQEVDLQRLVKAGSGPVTIDVLASFTASGVHPYTLGMYTPGNPSDRHELFYTLSSDYQTVNVNPQGNTSFDPGTSPFSFYFVSNVQVQGRIGTSEDAFNTWDTTNQRKFRFFPMENPDGSVVPNEYIMTSTEWDAPIGYDFTNIVAIVSNVKAAPGSPNAPLLGLQDLNALPGSSTMIFNRIQNPNATLGDIVHDTGVLQINNSGGSALTISSYNLSSAWTLVSPPAFPLTIPAGSSQDLTIKFIATSEPSHPYNQTNDIYQPNNGGVYNGTLTLNSNDPIDPTKAVSLAGWWQNQSENSEEPSLQSIINLMIGYGTNINPTPTPHLTEGSTAVYYGEEVVSPYWTIADPSQPVSVRQIDAFHTQGNTSTLYWFPQGTTTTHKLFTTATDVGQSLFPYLYGTTTPAGATFTPTGPFGFNVDGAWSVDSMNSGGGGAGHHVRFFPVRDSAGNIVPGTYLMAMDYGVTPENYDFQDNVYLVSNVQPVS